MQNFKEIAREQSSLSNDTDIVIATYDSVIGKEVLVMLEVQRGTDASKYTSAYSATWSDDGSAFGQPMVLTQTYINLLSRYGEGDTVLVAGLGGGILSRQLEDRNITVLTIEPDLAVIKLARLHWGFDGPLRKERFSEWVAKQPSNVFDCIVLDVYCARENVTPMRTAIQHYGNIKGLLTEDGMVVINSHEEDLMEQELIKLVENVGGFHLSKFPAHTGLNVSNNTVFILSVQPYQF